MSNDSGISYSCYRHNYFKRRTQSRMMKLGLESFEDYYNYIKTNPSEINDFLNNFTINYTIFFRNNEVFQKINQIFKSCIENNKIGLKSNLDFRSLSIYKKICQNQKLKIWSCPCATGEEPYSIAMLLDQLSKKYQSFPDYEIVASDIDKNALKMAKKGIFRQKSFSEMKNFYKNYFEEKDHKFSPTYIIDENIKKRINFIEEDITKGHELSNKYDVIFCRYLFIYINRSHQENLIKVLENHLASGGLLILGKTESLMYSRSKLELIDNHTRIYVKF